MLIFKLKSIQLTNPYQHLESGISCNVFRKTCIPPRVTFIGILNPQIYVVCYAIATSSIPSVPGDSSWGVSHDLKATNRYVSSYLHVNSLAWGCGRWFVWTQKSGKIRTNLYRGPATFSLSYHPLHTLEVDCSSLLGTFSCYSQLYQGFDGQIWFVETERLIFRTQNTWSTEIYQQIVR